MDVAQRTNIKVIAFDLDNTLTHRDKTIEKYSEYLVQQFDLENNLENLSKVQNIIRKIDNGGYPKKELLTHSSIAASVAYSIINSFEWQKQPDLPTMTNFWFEHFPKLAVEMPEARVLLENLKSHGYRLAVISNGKHSSRLSTIQNLGFESFFDVIISSEKVGIKKPEAKIFLKTCEILSVQTDQCLFVGDHPINDYQGASHAGMQAVLLDGFHPIVDENMLRIKNLSEVLHYL